MQQEQVDVLVVGAGYGGIYELYTLRRLGLSVKVIDKASGVGGTWFWNRYPGAMSDTESYLYRYSWDKEDLLTYPWPRHYVKQAEVLRYLEHVVDKYDMRKHMEFNTELTSATWDDHAKLWKIQLSTGECSARYLITALGLLSEPNFPDIPGLDSFKGVLAHTATWDPSIQLDGKRVGVIGCGSTGVQVITAIAGQVKSLVCYQRHPQYSVPSGDRPVSPEYRKWVNENYDSIWEGVQNSSVCFGIPESNVSYASVPPEQREQIFEDLWSQGNGFRFMFSGFRDITTDREANEAACEFIRKKIANTVKDQDKARKLMPRDLYARRPLCDGGYYEQFNRSNVSIVDLKETPITAIVPEGIRVSDGSVEPLDVIIFATGFDAIDGSYNRIRFKGRNEETLRDHWAERGPVSYLGITCAGFPNFFMVSGPQGPFTNIPPALELQVETHAKLIAHAEKTRREASTAAGECVAAIIEPSLEAEREWVATAESSAEGSLFKETASWIFGANVSGKTVALRFYFGGFKKYRLELEDRLKDNYRGFKPVVPR